MITGPSRYLATVTLWHLFDAEAFAARSQGGGAQSSQASPNKSQPQPDGVCADGERGDEPASRKEVTEASRDPAGGPVDEPTAENNAAHARPMDLEASSVPDEEQVRDEQTSANALAEVITRHRPALEPAGNDAAGLVTAWRRVRDGAILQALADQESSTPGLAAQARLQLQDLRRITNNEIDSLTTPLGQHITRRLMQAGWSPAGVLLWWSGPHTDSDNSRVVDWARRLESAIKTAVAEARGEVDAR